MTTSLTDADSRRRAQIARTLAALVVVVSASSPLLSDWRPFASLCHLLASTPFLLPLAGLLAVLTLNNGRSAVARNEILSVSGMELLVPHGDLVCSGDLRAGGVHRRPLPARGLDACPSSGSILNLPPDMRSISV